MSNHRAGYARVSVWRQLCRSAKLLLVLLSGAGAAYGQCPNITGVYYDTQGGKWTLTQQGNSLIGNYFSNVCGGVDQTITGGTYNSATGAFDIDIGSGCLGTTNWNYSGTFSSCVNATGTYVNFPSFDSWGINLTAACVVPATETTTQFAWITPNRELVPPPNTPNYFKTSEHEFSVQVYRAGTIFTGRDAREVNQYALSGAWRNGIDSCKQQMPTSPILEQLLIQTSTPFTYDETQRFSDVVGWNKLAIRWYRDNIQTSSCSFTKYQQMQMQCVGGWIWYRDNTLVGAIHPTAVTGTFDTDLSNCRDGVCATRAYPDLEAPTNVAATRVSDTQINLTWKENSFDATSFLIERKIGASGTWEFLTHADRTFALLGSGGAGVVCDNSNHGNTQCRWRDIGAKPGTFYYYRVQANMDAGQGQVRSGPFSSEAGACTCVAVASAAWTPATSADIAYSPNWLPWPDSYGYTNMGAKAAGDTARFSFSGDSIAYWFPKAGWAGIADVKIDGQSKGSLNLFAPYDALWAVGKYYGGLGTGNHTIEITVTGETSGIDSEVGVFGFELGLVGLPPGIYGGPQSHRGFNWTVQPGGSGWTCSLLDSADFRFDGNSLTYYHGKGPQYAVAAITIDGVSHGEIDLYNPEQLWGESDAFTNLGPGPHILHIESVYTNPNAISNCIDVAGLEVQ